MDYSTIYVFAYMLLFLLGAGRRVQAQPAQTNTTNTTTPAPVAQTAGQLIKTPSTQFKDGHEVFKYVRLELKTLRGHVMVSWDIQDAYLNQPYSYSLMTEYVAGNCTTAESKKQEIPLDSLVRSYELKDVIPWKSLMVTLKGKDKGQNVVYGMSAQTNTHETAPNGTVSNIQATSLQPDSAKLTWEPPPCQDRGGILKNYAIVISPIKDPNKKTPLASTREFLDINNLQPFTEYQALIAYVNGEGQGPFSSPFTFWTSEGPPSSPFIYNFTFDDVTIGVIIVEPLQPNGRIEQYNLELTGGNTGTSNLVTPLNGTEYIIGKLLPNTTYSIRVRARNGAGWGMWSPYISVKTKDEVKPIPQNLRQNLANSSCIGFSWSPPDADMGTVNSYRVTISSKEDFKQTVVDKNVLNFNQCGLSPYKQYAVTVSVMREAGQLGQSMGALMWTEGLVPPKPPQPRVMQSTSTTITVQIFPVIFDGGPITSYEIRLLKLQDDPTLRSAQNTNNIKDSEFQNERNPPNFQTGEGPNLVPISPQQTKDAVPNTPQQNGPEIHPVGKRSARLLNSDATRSIHDIPANGHVNKNHRLIVVIPDTPIRQQDLSLWCRSWKQRWLADHSNNERVGRSTVKIAKNFTNGDDVSNVTGSSSSYTRESDLVYKIQKSTTVSSTRSDAFLPNIDQHYMTSRRDKLMKLHLTDKGNSHGHIASSAKKFSNVFINHEQLRSTSAQNASVDNYGNVHFTSRRKRDLGNPPGVLWLEIPASEVYQPSYITIGDGKLHYGKQNVPLQPGTEYDVVFVVKSTVMDVTKHAYSFASGRAVTAEAVKSEEEEDDDSRIWLIVLLAILIPILVILFIMCGFFVIRHLARSKETEEKREKRRDSNYQEELSEDEQDYDLESDIDIYQGYEKPLRVSNVESSKNTRDPETFFNPINTLGQPRYINSMRDNVRYPDNTYPSDVTKNRSGNAVNAVNASLNNIWNHDGNNSAMNIITSSSRSSSGTSLVGVEISGGSYGIDMIQSSISQKDAMCHNCSCNNYIGDISGSVLELIPGGLEDVSMFTHVPRRNADGSSIAETNTTNDFDEESLSGSNMSQLTSNSECQMTFLENMQAMSETSGSLSMCSVNDVASSSLAEFRKYSNLSLKVSGEMKSDSAEIQSSSSRLFSRESLTARSPLRTGVNYSDDEAYLDPQKVQDIHNRNNSNIYDADSPTDISGTCGLNDHKTTNISGTCKLDDRNKFPFAETNLFKNDLPCIKLPGHKEDLDMQKKSPSSLMQLNTHMSLRKQGQSIFSNIQDLRKRSTDDVDINIKENQSPARKKYAALSDKKHTNCSAKTTGAGREQPVSLIPLSQATSGNRISSSNIGVSNSTDERRRKNPGSYSKENRSCANIGEPNCGKNVSSVLQKSSLQKSNNNDGRCHSCCSRSMLGCQCRTSPSRVAAGQECSDGSECHKFCDDGRAQHNVQKILVSSIESVYNVNKTIVNKTSCQDKHISDTLVAADNASLEQAVCNINIHNNIHIVCDTTVIRETKQPNTKHHIPLGSKCCYKDNSFTEKKHQREIDTVFPAVGSSNSLGDTAPADMPKEQCIDSCIEDVTTIFLEGLPDEQLKCSCGELPFSSCSISEIHQSYSGSACRNYTTLPNSSGFTAPSEICNMPNSTSVLKLPMTKTGLKVSEESFPALMPIGKTTDPPVVADTMGSLEEQLKKTSLECMSSREIRSQKTRCEINGPCPESLPETSRYSPFLEGSIKRFKCDGHLNFDLLGTCGDPLDSNLDFCGINCKTEDLNDGYTNKNMRTSPTGLQVAEAGGNPDSWGNIHQNINNSCSKNIYRNINNSCNRNSGKDFCYNNSHTTGNSLDDDGVAEEEVEEDNGENVDSVEDETVEDEDEMEEISDNEEENNKSPFEDENVNVASCNENGNNNSPDPEHGKKDNTANSESSNNMKKFEGKPDKTYSLLESMSITSQEDLDHSSNRHKCSSADMYLTMSTGSHRTQRTLSKTELGLSMTRKKKESEQFGCPASRSAPSSQSAPVRMRHNSDSPASDGSYQDYPAATDFYKLYKGSDLSGKKSVTFEKEVNSPPMNRSASHLSSASTESPNVCPEKKIVKPASQRRRVRSTSSKKDGDIKSSKSAVDSMECTDNDEMSSGTESLGGSSSSSGSIPSKDKESVLSQKEAAVDKSLSSMAAKTPIKKQWFHIFNLKKLRAKLETRQGDTADKKKPSMLESDTSDTDISSHETNKLMESKHDKDKPLEKSHALKEKKTSTTEPDSWNTRKKQGLFSLFLHEKSNRNENKPKDKRKNSLFQKDRSRVFSFGSSRNKNTSYKKQATGVNRRGRLNNPGQVVSFEDEFKALEQYKQRLLKTLRFDTALLNPDRNRFNYILPPDHTRVNVEITSPGDSDYYNASYMDIKSDIHYIAAQSPFSTATVSDFWRLILQNKVETIVMMSKCMKGDMVKCVQYWSDSGVFADGPVLVETVDQQQYADFSIRTLKVSASSFPEVMVSHFQFETWPIYDVPDDPVPLLELRYRVRRNHGDRDTPILVHCDTGVEQTAIFIAVDLLIEQYGLDGSVNVYGFVKAMRRSRPYMVRTLQQYKFIYECLFEEFQAGDTILRFDLDEKFKALIAKNPQTGFSYLMDEFRMLTEFTPNIDPSACAAGLLPENAEKNVDPAILPPDSYRPTLSIQGNPFIHGYINAVFVDGLRRQREFLVTQTPINNTVNMFWRMIYDYQVHTIVSLGTNDGPNQAQYIPHTGTRKFEHLLVEHINVSTQGPITIRNLKLCVETAAGMEKRAIRHFQVSHWEDEDNILSRKIESSPNSHADLVDLLGLVMDWQMIANRRTRPIVVCCKNGATSSGIFCSCAVLCERLREDKEVDLYHTVKHIKRRRPQFIADFDQYRFLHVVLWEYMQNYLNKEGTALDGGESSQEESDSDYQELGVQTEPGLLSTNEDINSRSQENPELNTRSQDSGYSKQVVLGCEDLESLNAQRHSNRQKCRAACCSGLYQRGSRSHTFRLAEDREDACIDCSSYGQYVGTCEDNVGNRESWEDICTCDCSEQPVCSDCKYRHMRETHRRQSMSSCPSRNLYPWRTQRWKRQLDCCCDRRMENRQACEDLMTKVTECSSCALLKQAQVAEQRVRFQTSGCQPTCIDPGSSGAEVCRDKGHVSPVAPGADVCSDHSSPTCTVKVFDESSSSEFDVSLHLV